MANPEQLTILPKSGVSAWNRRRMEDANAVPDLENADLRGKNLRNLNWADAGLDGVKLRE